MFVYDFPLSPKARTYLKFEAIFNRLQESADLNTNAETLSLLRGLIDFIDLLDGSGTLKIELGKDLDKLSNKLKNWQNNPEADQGLISELLEQINESHKALNNFTRQRTVLQNDPIIESIKTRFLTPSGINCFDTPLFIFWSNLDREEKIETASVWLKELDCIRIPITCILNLWRLFSDYQSRVAINGFMQETSEPCELIEIKYPKHVRGYPVVSGFQSNINVRFFPYVKGAPVGDITFELAYVRGGIN
ncbi:cell division protein ZapD [Anaerobiospirillum sp. NML120448]|uniref:cell division protein ZapD n=1 Tax=Anaerobiospirillum sp. NML120448 TaxID=2932816 RepID=UPI001FF445C5|nr:cell division protein ZapD [Anaerobiospirillum sp. NML120448]MCK0513748.1 cell division protein ZapD [Anaerobiospirillum sp. NML120448]